MLNLSNILLNILSNSFLQKMSDNFCLDFFNECYNDMFIFRQDWITLILGCIGCDLQCFLHCLLRLLLANIAPCTFNIGHCSFVDSLNVWLCKGWKHCTWERRAKKGFRFDTPKYFSAKLIDLLDKFWTQLRQIHFCKILKVFFISERTNHGLTVSVLEEGGE